MHGHRRINRRSRISLVAAIAAAAALWPGSPLAPRVPAAQAATPASVFGGPLANLYVPYIRVVPPIGAAQTGDINRPYVVGGLWNGHDPPKPPAPVFLGAAEGNLDSDTTFDVWSVTSDGRTWKGPLDGGVASGEPSNEQNDVNEPVNLATGNYYLEQSLPPVEGKGPLLQLRLSYNSQDQLVHPFGIGWQANWTVQLAVDPVSGNVTVITEEGRQDLYTLNAGIYQPPLGQFAQLVKNGDGSYDLRRKDRSDLHFSAQGVLQAVADRNGNALRFNYSGSGQLVSIADAAGRSEAIAYGPGGQPQNVTDPIGRVTSLTYDGTGHLVGVSDPAGELTAYAYAGGRLVTVTSARGNVVVSNTYDTQGRVIQQRDALGDLWTMAYGAGQTTVTDPRGCTTNTFFDVFFRINAESDCATTGQTLYTYDANGRVATQTDPLGRTDNEWHHAGDL
jgi:YD repeat-containing protein